MTRGAPAGRHPALTDDVIDRVRALCLALPEVTVRVDLARNATRSDSYAYYVRQSSFCLLVARPTRSGRVVPLLVIRADPEEQAALLSHGRPPPTRQVAGVADRIGDLSATPETPIGDVAGVADRIRNLSMA